MGHKGTSQGSGRFLLRRWPAAGVLKGEPEPPRSGERPGQREGHVQRPGRWGGHAWWPEGADGRAEPGEVS